MLGPLKMKTRKRGLFLTHKAEWAFLGVESCISTGKCYSLLFIEDFVIQIMWPIYLGERGYLHNIDIILVPEMHHLISVSGY